jgi:hypothetical protein
VIDFLRHMPGCRRRRQFLHAHRQVAPREIARWMQPFPYRQKISRKLRLGTTRAAVG